MSNFIKQRDLMLEISRRPERNTSGMLGVNKFGESTNVDNEVKTDIWDGANSSDDIDIWVAPTQARIHNIVSSSTSDDGDPVGVGAQTVEIFGLTSWDTTEVMETITMNGTGNVATINSYVIIHRMQVALNGATSINVGVIKATAVTDSTITAQIGASLGQTHMAIYGVPSGYTFYIVDLYAGILKSGGAGFADVSLEINPDPDVELTGFRTEHTFGVSSAGTSHINEDFRPYKPIKGPAIIKMQAVGSADNLDIDAGFDGILAID